MARSIQLSLSLALLVLALSCTEKEEKPAIAMDEVFAWCIVPFDSEKRSPQEFLITQFPCEVPVSKT